MITDDKPENFSSTSVEEFFDLLEARAILQFLNTTLSDTPMNNEEKTIGNAETALLGLLAEGSKHAYQIEKDVEFRAMRLWTDLSMSSIYKLLNKLEEDGLVVSEMIQSDNNKLRRVYKLTAPGREALSMSIREIFKESVVAKNPFDVAVYFSDNLSNEEAAEGLNEYRGELEKKIAEYEGLAKYLGDTCDGAGPQGLAARTAAMLKGEMEWLKNHISLIKGRQNDSAAR